MLLTKVSKIFDVSNPQPSFFQQIFVRCVIPLAQMYARNDVMR